MQAPRAVIQVENNGSFGILVEKGSVTINSVVGKSSYPFETSRINGNGKTGIYASRDEGYRPDPEGLYPDATGHLTATCIEVIGNGASGTTDKQKSGIYAEGKVNLTLAKVTDNKGFGVYTRKDVTIQGEENTFSGNAGMGIHSWEGSVDASWGVIKVENNGSYGIATDRGFVTINWNNVANKAFYDNEFSTIRGNGKSGIKTSYNNTYSTAGLSGTINGNYIHITGNTSTGIDAGNDVTLRHGDVCNNTGGNVSVKGTIYVNDVNLCDADMDGVSDLIEAAGPNNGDGNNDGIADALQKEVATLKTLMGKYSTITFLPEGESPAVWVGAPGEFPYGSPQGVSFQSGVVSVTADVSKNKVIAPLDLSNATIFKIEHIIHDAGPVNTYWIYGPTVQDPVSHWYEFPFDGTTGAVINGNKVTLYIADGGRGDGDLLKNGRVSFLGAPGSLADHSMISITLNQGWNFISLPSQPLVPATHSVLHDIIDNVRIVWGYDNGAKKWLRFKKLAAGVEDPINLATMETGPGYWVYANGATAFSLPCLDVSPNIALTE
ncbi:MAG: choice-of-anchor U domain-containing protein, partial [Deltaproteobacteria bacterium]